MKTKQDPTTIQKKTQTKIDSPIKKGTTLKPKFKKNKNKVKPPQEEKNIKIVLNLTKCSNNWKQLPAELKPKVVKFKRQGASHLIGNKRAKTNMALSKQQQHTKPNEENSKIWFDVDNIFLPEAADTSTKNVEITKTLNDSTRIESDETRSKLKVTKAVALDCEMVGVGENGKDSILARVSIVNQYSDCIYDKYVMPTEKVTDYRTNVSGIRPDDLKKENGALPFSVVQKEVADILKDRILVGHAVHNDLQVLFLSHSKKKIRDTQKCKVFRRLHSSLGGLSSLKNLAKLLLGITIQEGEHSSVVDAQATMRMYTMYKKEWEADLHNRTIKTVENKLARNVESEKIVKNGILQDKGASVEIKTGNETHKKYLINKLRKRNSFIKKFKK
jgi:RNA exonuclease 4